MRPLDDIRVLELGQVIAAPYGSLLLADMGAEVIKVERPGIGDSARSPAVTGLSGFSGAFLTFNRNKRSVALDLKDPGDYRSFEALVRSADVVLDNYVPSVARRLRIDHDSLVRINPRIISCSISGFGADSPHADKPSYDLVHQALTGYMRLSGSEGDPPTRLGIPLADLAAGLFAAYGVLGAIRNRDRTGHGDAISISMYDCLISLLTYQATMHFASGQEPRRMGSAHEFVIPWQAFETSDGHVVVAARAAHFWVEFCTAAGLDQLVDDPRFQTNQQRLKHRDELEEILNARMREQTTAHWVEVLSAARVPSAPVRGIGQALRDPHVDVRGMVQEYEHPEAGTVRFVSNPVQFAGIPRLDPLAPPDLGADDGMLDELLDRAKGTNDDRF